MPQVCTQCAHANPPDAVYCHFDGLVLAGRGQGGPVAVGARPFANPFVFPAGRTCRNYDELVLACQAEWPAACQLLKDGFLESFFSGLGRVDLALAARAAARFPDLERGLDGLLGQLPSSVLQEPKLRVEPLEVNLGVLDNDQPRTFQLELENVGMRLLYGTVTSDAVWLTLGDGAGAAEKHFHITHDQRIAVRVHADRVRAGNKPVTARLLVSSNAGTAEVSVRAEKPVRPFPPGPLAGARTPRDVAERALKNAREVAPLFESGEVARWYASNGWTYPVKLPAASGPAVVQQFFEALGVTRPPRVEISHKELVVRAAPGAAVPLTLDVSSQEKRPVFAHATSDVPWLEVGRPKYNGRSVTLPMTIPTVPNRPGETLKGELAVVSNGNQRWIVPVRLEITAGNAAFDFAAPPPPPPLPVAAVAPVLEPEPIVAPRQRRRGGIGAMHVIPAVLLLVAVGCVVAFDLLSPLLRRDRVAEERPPTAPSRGAGPDYDAAMLKDRKALVGVTFNPEHRFGVVLVDVDDPFNKGKWKRLTYHEDGRYNNTRVKVGESDYLFGHVTPSNRWMRGFLKPRPLDTPVKDTGWLSKMDFNADKVEVTQHVQIVPGQSMLLDTVLIYYVIRNYNTIDVNVSLRIMLDGYIGANDGVPFLVPGRKGFVTTKADFTGAEVPDYLEAVENPDDETKPGTIARIGLRGISWGDVELIEPSRVTISRFENKDIGWDWELKSFQGEDKEDKPDSCVAVYWPQQRLKPRETRHLAITYGLGRLDVTGSLALSAPSTVAPDREFVVTAYVYNARAGQKVTLQVPEGLSLIEGAERTVEEAGRRSQVSWRLRGRREGTYQIEAASGTARSKPLPIKVVKPKARSIFG